MRKLSNQFMDELKNGFLQPLLAYVQRDKDLTLDIRKGYLNIYYKGNSLLKLVELTTDSYQVNIDKKFRGELLFTNLVDIETTMQFLANVPVIKANIEQHGSKSVELEYEQMIIRANNREVRNANEYFIVDRQYASGSDRIDLTGIYWNRENRRYNRVVQPCVLEVKFALNSDIKTVHQQLQRYYDRISHQASHIAQEIEVIFKQKLDLGLYQQSREQRIDAMKELQVSQKLEDFLFVLILIDYNHASSLFNINNLKQLAFSDQVRVFYTGFAMWESNLSKLKE